MQEFLKSIRENQIVTGCILLAAGVCLLCFPAASLNTLIRIAGIALLLSGGVGAAAFAGTKTRNANDYLQAAICVIAFILGLVAVIVPERIKATLGVVLGLLIILSSLRAGIRMYSSGVDVKSWPMIQAVIVLVVGVIFLFVPGRMVNLLAKLGGIVFIVQAVTNFLGYRAAASAGNNTKYR